MSIITPVPDVESSEKIEEQIILQPEKLSDVDRMALEVAKLRKDVALAEAKTALANNEKADISYKYVVLQLYMKYGLTEVDGIAESGEIIRNGNKS